MGAINLLNICKNIKGIKAILMITTDKVYLNKEINKSYKESDPLGGLDPYSSSKAASEIAIQSFDKSFLIKKIVLILQLQDQAILLVVVIGRRID